jgi:hypothetical protein
MPVQPHHKIVVHVPRFRESCPAMSDITLLWLSAGLSVVGPSALLAALVVSKRRQAPEAAGPSDIPAAPPGAGPIARLDFGPSCARR